jgi:hypothetical protein
MGWLDAAQAAKPVITRDEWERKLEAVDVTKQYAGPLLPLPGPPERGKAVGGDAFAIGNLSEEP